MAALRDGRWFWWVLGACALTLGADAASLGPFADADDSDAEVEVLGDQIERAPATSSTTVTEPVTVERSTTTTTAIEWTPMPILPPDAELPPPTDPPSPVTTAARTTRSAPVRTTAAPQATATTEATTTTEPVDTTTTTEFESIPAPTTSEPPSDGAE